MSIIAQRADTCGFGGRHLASILSAVNPFSGLCQAWHCCLGAVKSLMSSPCRHYTCAGSPCRVLWSNESGVAGGLVYSLNPQRRVLSLLIVARPSTTIPTIVNVLELFGSGGRAISYASASPRRCPQKPAFHILSFLWFSFATCLNPSSISLSSTGSSVSCTHSCSVFEFSIVSF